MAEVKRFSDSLAQNREFELGGEMFKWRYPYWEEMAAIFDEDVASLRNGDKPLEEYTTKESIEQTIQRILVFLDPENDAINRWKKLGKRKVDPVPFYMFSQVYRWLLEVTTGRPTGPPSGSEPGGGNSEASSPDGSPSTEVIPT